MKYENIYYILLDPLAQRAQQEIDKQNYKLADYYLKRSLYYRGKILFVRLRYPKENALIDSIRDSEKLANGLQGYCLSDNKWIRREEYDALTRKVKFIQKDAEELYLAAKCAEMELKNDIAINKYCQLINLILTNEMVTGMESLKLKYVQQVKDILFPLQEEAIRSGAHSPIDKIDHLESPTVKRISFKNGSIFEGIFNEKGIPDGKARFEDKGHQIILDGMVSSWNFEGNVLLECEKGNCLAKITDSVLYCSLDNEKIFFQFDNSRPDIKVIGKNIAGVGDYYGYFQNFIPTGQGVMRYYNGDTFEGLFKNGIPVGPGKGKVKLKDDSTYEGELYGLVPSGAGTIYFSNGSYYQGQFANGKPSGKGTGQILLTNGAKYKGDLLGLIPNGYGNIYYLNGDYFEGIFDKGKVTGQGKGKLTLEDGSIFEGVMKGLKEGRYGTIRFQNGDYYNGEVQNFQPNGTGEIKYKRFCYLNKTMRAAFQYVGQFKNGTPNGKGKFVTKTGIYNGYVSEGKPIGPGVFIGDDGLTIKIKEGVEF